MRLSVLIAAFNERLWVREIVKRVVAQKIEGITDLEVVIVDDGSTDGTRDIIEALRLEYPDKIIPIFHKKNLGKGAAIQSAIEKMRGDVCIIQDADLEYDPFDYPKMLRPIIEGKADCVYGSRFIGSEPKRVLFFWHYLGNRFLTLISNIFTDLNLTDIETCYKAFRSDVLKSIPLRSRDFCFEPEITSKIAQKKCRIYEVGISYDGRNYEQGKKVTWVDGFKALWTIVKYGIGDDSTH